LCKKRGPVNKFLCEVIENYNNNFHRGLGMSPNDAMIPENQERIRANESKYCKEFKVGKKEYFEIGERVFIKNECRNSKNEDLFSIEGVITDNVSGSIWKVRTTDGKEFTRHASQLKRFGRGMLDVNIQ
jgi:hypothetical protein